MRGLLPALVLILAAARPAVAEDDLRARAIVGAYGRLAGQHRDPKVARAFAVIRSKAPRLLHDLPVQRLYWTASTPLKGAPNVREIKKARGAIARAGLAAELKDGSLRKAFRYFFQVGALRQRLAPMLESAQADVPVILAASRQQACLRRLRVANTAALLFEVENGRSPGETPAKVVRSLLETGYLAPDPRCDLDLGSCGFSPVEGFRCDEVGSSQEPRAAPVLNTAALRSRAERNAYLAAVLELAPVDEATGAFDADLRRSLMVRGADPAQGLALATRAGDAFPADDPGLAGFSLGFYEVELMLEQRNFDGARGRLDELVGQAEERDPPRQDQLAAVEGVRARLERMAGRWPASAEAAARSDQLLISAFGREDTRRVGPLLSKAISAKLAGDHAKASGFLDEAIGLLEDAGLKGLTPAYLLVLGRSDAARGALKEAGASLTRVVRELTGSRDARSVYRVAAGQYLRGLVHQMSGHGQQANQDFAQAALAVARSPVVTPALIGLEPEVLAGFGSLCRVRRAFEVGATFLGEARNAARREGGEAHPTLARIDEEYKRLVDDQRRFVEGKTKMMQRLEEISGMIRDGKYAEAREQAGYARKDMASAGGDRNMLGWLRFFEFQSLFKAGDYPGAYASLTAKAQQPYEIPPQNRGYMASVGVELATRLKKPAAEVVTWGQRCYDIRLQSGDPGAAVLCARNAVKMLTLRDEETKAAPFAEKLVEQGKGTKNGDLILEGFQTLGEGLLRERQTGMAQKLIARLDTTLASLRLSPAQRKRRNQLVKAWVEGKAPPSHAKELEDLLSKK